MTAKQDRIDALRRAAEAELARATPALPKTSPAALLHELQVHQIELEMQNQELQQAQISLEAARDRYASLFNFAPVAYLSLSPHGIVVEANRAADRLLCRPLAKLLRRPFEDFIATTEHERWREHFSATWQAEPNRTQDLELLMYNTDGSNTLAQLQCMAVDGPDGSRTMRLALFDITERNRNEADTQRLANYDALTHLPNRRLLQDRLEHALASAARTGLHGAILFLDLDNFKALNDHHGHDAGDRLLVEIARRLRSGVREGDTVARIGGDEFVMILEGLGPSAETAAVLAKQIGHKLNEAVAVCVGADETAFECTASIGARLFQAGESIDELLRHADLAMYQAKAAGRHQVHFFDDTMQTALDEREELERALATAVERDQLELYYQPQFNGARRIIGAEALLRWRHPEQGQIGPERLVALTEQSELLLSIERWVLDKACERLACWSGDEHTQALTLSINVGTRQFRQKAFVDQVRRALTAHGARPRQLVLELSEPTLLADAQDSTRKMKAIRGLGVRLSIDRFGSGCSSLSNLTHHLIDQVKIDRSFIHDLEEPGGGGVAVTAIISMARSLGLDIVAHGIETETQRTLLESKGCDAYQGVLYCEPLPLHRFEHVVNDPAAFGL